ncbi:MAG: cobalamin-independent methionine synthase II family protein [Acidobacteria bacterium]|nr:cobalamin-independent methionine synthase II family protein [Acidobacteriota bacterium]
MTKVVTTTIGSFPKPDYVPVGDWSQRPSSPPFDGADFDSRDLEARFAMATKAAVMAQIEAGVDVPTDGEMRREHYIFYHLRHLSGVDFERLQLREIRSGAWEREVPTIIDRVLPKERFLPSDYKIAQSYSSQPIKITVPGPMTIADTVADEHYGDPQRLNRDLADALNVEILALAAGGCRHIQVDEPVFARKTKEALAFGIDNLERCFAGVPKDVQRIVHLCCGYPRHLDQPAEDVFKADPAAYFELAEALDLASVDAISIEDAHRPVDLGLLDLFERSTVILGLIAIAKTRVESTEEIRQRLDEALSHIDPERLVAAPDCGLGMLDLVAAKSKLANLTAAAKSFD